VRDTGDQFDDVVSVDLTLTNAVSH